MHVIAGLAPENGGPSYSVPRLCRALAEEGCPSALLTIGAADGPAVAGVETVSFPLLSRLPPLSTLRVSPSLERALHRRAASADVIHDHGLWLMPNVHAGRAARRTKRPLVVSPRGMLAPAALAFSRLRKRLFWALLQRRAFASAAAWHATSHEEADDIRAFGIRAPVVVIPNGVDMPTRTAVHADDTPRRRLLFLSRIHPKKGLARLIDAWGVVAPERPAWDLAIAGPDEGGHRADLERQARARGIPRVHFVGPVYGDEKEALLATADLFVLPTLNENFGLAVAEALAAGIPAIVTKGAPWSKLEEQRCGWWIDHGVEPLVAALRAATALDPTIRREMGRRGSSWVAHEFSWNAIARQMVELYGSLAPPGRAPSPR